MMIDQFNIKQIANNWEFANEAELENFLWWNLPSLLSLQHFKKQYS